MGSLLQKDTLISCDIFNVEGTPVRFIRLDRACNFREVACSRKGWILMLGFPVTLMNDMYPSRHGFFWQAFALA
jgi:hypothetical protein